jgi:hypothetical protein
MELWLLSAKIRLSCSNKHWDYGEAPAGAGVESTRDPSSICIICISRLMGPRYLSGTGDGPMIYLIWLGVWLVTATLVASLWEQ